MHQRLLLCFVIDIFPRSKRFVAFVRAVQDIPFEKCTLRKATKLYSDFDLYFRFEFNNMNALVKPVFRGIFILSRKQLIPPTHYACSLFMLECVNNGKCLLSNNTMSSSFESTDTNQILEVMRKFGVNNDETLKKVVNLPLLSRGGPNSWHTLLNTMINYSCKPTSVVHMALKYPKLLQIPPERLQNAWANWLGCLHKNDLVRNLIISYPALLSLQKHEIESKFYHLRAVIGSPKFVSNLLMKCPQIMFQRLSQLQEVSDYISEEMVVRNAAEYYKSVALGCSFKEIKTRHVFLVRCGKYKTPNLKQSDKIPTGNPSLSDIYDSSEEEFATRVAGLTLEEYVVFQAMFETELKETEESESDDSDSD